VAGVNVFILLIIAIATIALVVHAAHTILTCNGTVVRGVISFQCLQEADRGR
jgi:hypothetical protein